ncbi:MAG: hypothetical protein WKG07_16115 [Hymenobacter sp.]
MKTVASQPARAKAEHPAARSAGQPLPQVHLVQPGDTLLQHLPPLRGERGRAAPASTTSPTDDVKLGQKLLPSSRRGRRAARPRRLPGHSLGGACRPVARPTVACQRRSGAASTALYIALAPFRLATFQPPPAAPLARPLSLLR